MEIKTNLHDYLINDVMITTKPFSWSRTIRRAIKHPERRYIFWWRIASHLFQSTNKFNVIIAKYINKKLISKYGTEIELGAKIDIGITFAHHQGIVVSKYAVIGKHLHIRQNVTIGEKTGQGQCAILIGDNVRIGANSCIINDNIKIGSNVDIGAMTYINKDVPDNCTIYSHKENIITMNNEKNGRQ